MNGDELMRYVGMPVQEREDPLTALARVNPQLAHDIMVLRLGCERQIAEAEVIRARLSANVEHHRLAVESTAERNETIREMSHDLTKDSTTWLVTRPNEHFFFDETGGSVGGRSCGSRRERARFWKRIITK